MDDTSPGRIPRSVRATGVIKGVFIFLMGAVMGVVGLLEPAYREAVAAGDPVILGLSGFYIVFMAYLAAFTYKEYSMVEAMGCG